VLWLALASTFLEEHGNMDADFDAVCKLAGKVADVAGGLLSTVSRIQRLLAKAAEKPYQARLLEARLNSCRALLQTLANSRMDAVHLEPLRIKLAYIEEMVERAGTGIYIYKITDGTIAKEFEEASAQLQEEETSLALVASAQIHALPGQRARSSSAGRKLAVPQRRRTRSRSSSSRRSGGGRSKSPLPSVGENTQDVTSDAFAPSRAQMANAIVTENEHEITLTDASSVDDVTESTPLRGGRSISSRADSSCCSEDSPSARTQVYDGTESSQDPRPFSRPTVTVRGEKEGMGQRSRCTKALIPFDLLADLIDPPDEDTLGKHASSGSSARNLTSELPLPPIYYVERESNHFWQDSVTLVFRCDITGQEHRVETQQWSRPDCTDTAGDRLMSWANKSFRMSKPWEEIKEEGSPSSSEQTELQGLLQKSGWYEKFIFDTDCRAWVAKEAASLKESATSGYVPCNED
jgi:hypothetical protein